MENLHMFQLLYRAEYSVQYFYRIHSPLCYWAFRFLSLSLSLSHVIILFLLKKSSRCFTFIEYLHLCVSGCCCCCLLDSKSRYLIIYKWMRLYVRMYTVTNTKNFMCKLKNANETNYQNLWTLGKTRSIYDFQCGFNRVNRNESTT